MQKKIVAVHLLNNLSGSPKIFAQALEALQEAGASIDLYSSGGPGFLDQSGDRRFRVPYRWSANRWIRLLNFSFSQIYLLFSLLKYWRAPVTIYVNTLLPFGAAFAGKLMGKPVVYHLHETHVEPEALNGFLQFWVRFSATHLVYVSEYLKEQLPFPGIRSEVIYNGIPDTYGCPEPRSGPGNPFEVLMIASLKKEKGLWEFVQLAESLPHFRFTLIVGAPKAQVDQFFGTHEIPANLELLPSQEEVAPFYQRADLLLNLSDPVLLPETFGMTILEGMAYSLPAIVPPVGGPSFLVSPSVEGYQVDGRDLKALHQVVNDLGHAPGTWGELSHNAWKKARRFSLSQFGKSIRAVFLGSDS